MKYAEDQDLFFNDYAEAHLKLSELGMPACATYFGHLHAIPCVNPRIYCFSSIKHLIAFSHNLNFSAACRGGVG